MEYYRPSNTSYIDNIGQDGDVALQPTKAIFKVRLNGICEIEVTIPYDKEGRWRIIERDGVIKAPTPYSEVQLFAVSNIKRGMFGLEIKALHIFFDLIKSTTEDIRAENKTCQQALDILLSGTRYKGHSDITKAATCYFIQNNRVAFINGSNDNTVVKRWGGEIFLDNYDIYVNEKIGQDKGVEISYGVSLLDIGLNESYTGIVTRGKAKAFNGRRLPELYVDSPLINNYRIIHEDFVEMEDLKLKSDSNDGTGFDTEEELYTAMRKRMYELYDKGLDKPTITGDIKPVALENTEKYKYVKALVNIGLGDTIHVNHKNIGADIQVRCIGYDWNILTKKYEDVVIGDEIKNYFNSNTDGVRRIDNILNSVVDPKGNLMAEKIKGFIDSTKTILKAQRDIAEKQQTRAILFEDLVPSSPTYGCLAIGTQGIEISRTRTADGRDWDFSTAITAEGIIADKIVGNLLASKDGSTSINMNNGEFRSKQADGSQIVISPQDGFYNQFGTSKREYHHLNYSVITTFPAIPNGNGYTESLIQLPDEFKNKNFEATVSISDTFQALVPSCFPAVAGFGTSVIKKDYINAKITIEGYLCLYDLKNEYFCNNNEHLRVILSVTA